MNEIRCKFCQNIFEPMRLGTKYCKSKCRQDYKNRKIAYQKRLTQKETDLEKLQSKLRELEVSLKDYLVFKEKRNAEEQNIRDLKHSSDQVMKILSKATDKQVFNYLVKKRKLPYLKGLNEEEFYTKDNILRSITPQKKQDIVRAYRIEFKEKEQLIDKHYHSLPLRFDVFIGDKKQQAKEEEITQLKTEITTLDQKQIQFNLPEPASERLQVSDKKQTKKDKQARITAMNVKKQGKSLTGAEVRSMHFETFTLLGELGEFLGQLDRNMVAFALTGDSGAGKSYFSYELAKLFLDNDLSVKYYSLEEGVGQLTKNKLDCFEIGKKLQVTAYATLDDIDREAENYDVIIIDSYSKISKDPDDYEILRQTHSQTLFIVIFQKTTAKTIRGGASITFNSAAIIDVQKDGEERIAVMKKSRYSTANWVYSITQGKIISKG